MARADDGPDLVAGWPDVGEIDGRPVGVGSERIGREVDVDPTGERERHDERRGGQVAGPRERMDPTLEVAVARQDGGDDEVVGLDGLGDRCVERPGVADAGRAAVAGQVEPERCQWRHEAGRLEVARDRLRPGSERGLDRRGDPEAARDRVAGEQAGSDHDGRVRRVGARRDGGDGHRAAGDGRALTGDRHGDRPIGAWIGPGSGRPGRRGVGPARRRLRRVERGRIGGRERIGRRLGHGVAVDRRVVGDRDRHVAQAVREVGPEVGPQVLEPDPVLRASGPGDGRLDRRKVEGQDLVELGPVARFAPQPLLLRVALHEVDALGRAPGEAQVGERLVIDREERRGGPELGAHVADRGAIGEGQAGEPVAGELDEGPDHAVPTQHLGHDQDEVRGGRALGQLPGQANPDHLGHRLVQRLTQQHRLGFDPADAVPQHAEGVDHRRVRVRADEGIGEGHAVTVVDDGCQELEVDLVDDAGAGRDDPQVAERGLRPAQELVALAVALVLALDVVGERIRRPEPVDVDRVVDDEVGLDERVDHGRVAPELGHRVAHDGQVDDGRHAGQVLEDHARRHERDLGLGGHARPPRRQRLDVTRVDDPATRMAQHVLEQDPDGHRQPGVAGPSTQGRQPVQVGEARAERRSGAEWIDPLHRV